MNDKGDRGSEIESVLLPLGAIGLLALGSAPIARLIPGGHDSPWYAARLEEWITGSLIATSMAVVLTVLARRLPLWRPHLWRDVGRRAAAHPLLTGCIVSLAAFCCYVAIARWIFGGVPLHLDELAQLYQARLFADGRVVATSPEFPEFTSLLHLVDFEGKRFSQYPPGGPLMLAPGVLVGVPWIMGPIFGAASVMMMWGICRRIEAPSVALAATLLFAFAPFTAFMSASHMNHVPALFWMLAASLALLRMTSDTSHSAWFAGGVGLSLGLLATIRPVDALAFALPAGLWILLRTVRTRRTGDIAAAGIGILIPVAALFWFNARTTGHPLLFGYALQWGAEHGLGFHAAPWGVAHTPARGLELVNLYLLRLQSYLFESPVPSLVFPLVALGLARRITAFDRYLLGGGFLVLLLYFAYWHDGFYLGPRFLYILAPLFALWAARLPSLARARWPLKVELHRGLVYTCMASLLIAAAISVPARARSYHGSLIPMRHDVIAMAEQTGVRNALVLVRESWGSQLIARMWALGVSRSATEHIYRNTDACVLENGIARAERLQMRGMSVSNALLSLTSDSLRLIPSTLSPDRSERVLPGSTYGAVCAERLAEDRQGFTLLAPLLTRSWDSNVYSRDLHARDSVLLRTHQGLVFLLSASSPEAGSSLVFSAVSRDSLTHAWSRANAP